MEENSIEKKKVRKRKIITALSTRTGNSTDISKKQNLLHSPTVTLKDCQHRLEEILSGSVHQLKNARHKCLVQTYASSTNKATSKIKRNSKINTTSPSVYIEDVRSATEKAHTRRRLPRLLSKPMKATCSVKPKLGNHIGQSASNSGHIIGQIASNSGNIIGQSASNSGNIIEQSASNSDYIMKQSASNSGYTIEQSASNSDKIIEQSASNSGYIIEQSASNSGYIIEQSASNSGITIGQSEPKPDIIKRTSHFVPKPDNNIGLNDFAEQDPPLGYKQCQICKTETINNDQHLLEPHVHVYRDDSHVHVYRNGSHMPVHRDEPHVHVYEDESQVPVHRDEPHVHVYRDESKVPVLRDEPHVHVYEDELKVPVLRDESAVCVHRYESHVCVHRDKEPNYCRTWDRRFRRHLNKVKSKTESISALYDVTAERDGINLCLRWRCTDGYINGFVIQESEDGEAWMDCLSVGKTVQQSSFAYFLDQKKKDWYIGICSHCRRKGSRLEQYSARASIHLATLSHPDTSLNDILKSMMVNDKNCFTETCSIYFAHRVEMQRQIPSRTSIMRKAFKNLPNCTNTESCFYNLICSPVNGARLPHHVGVKIGETQNIDYQFSINQILSGIMWAAREQVIDCDRFRVIVRMCAMKEGCKTPQEDEIPDCIMFVNSKLVLVQTDNKHRGSLDITDNCKFNKYAPSYNTLRIEWRHNVKHYCVTVSVVELLDTEGVLSKLMLTNIRPPENIIKDKLKSDTDVSYTSFRTQLTCPLGKSRMVTPCRGSYCTHFYCMDALTLLKLNETRPLSKKKCFVCDQPLEFLYIDGLFLNILQGVPEMVNEVKFEKDGCWSYTQHTNNDPDDTKPVCCETSDHKLPLKNMNGNTDLKTSNDSIDDSPLLTTQLEKIKLQLDKLSNLTTTPIKDELINEDTVTVDDEINKSNNVVEIVSDAVDLTEGADSVYMDKDDKTGLLEEELEPMKNELEDKNDELSMDDEAYGNMVELEISRLLNKSKQTVLPESVERRKSQRKPRSIKSDNKEASNKAGWSKCGELTKIIHDKKKAPYNKKRRQWSLSKIHHHLHESMTFHLKTVSNP